jgi:hypothetical protein
MFHSDTTKRNCGEEGASYCGLSNLSEYQRRVCSGRRRDFRYREVIPGMERSCVGIAEGSFLTLELSVNIEGTFFVPEHELPSMYLPPLFPS